MLLNFLVPYAVEVILGVVSISLLGMGAIAKKNTEYIINVLLATLGVLIAILYGSYLRVGYSDVLNIINLMLILTSMFSMILLKAYASYQVQQSYQRPVFLIFTIIGAGIAIKSQNLIECYLGLELFSLSLYCLIGYDKYNPSSIKSVTHSILMGLCSSAIIVFGISLVYGYSASLEFSEIRSLSNMGVALGIGLIICGFLIKLAVVPFHFWLIRLYDGILLPLISVYAITVQIVLLLLIFKLRTLEFFDDIFLFISIISMIIGAFGSLSQTNLKKLIAYLVIMNTGYALIPITTAGFEESYRHLVVYLMAYSFAMFGFIAVICSFRNGNNLLTDIKSLSGLGKVYPLRMVVLLIFMLSLLGFPPFGGFFARFSILSDAFLNGYYFQAIFAIFTSMIGFILIAKMAKILFFEKGEVLLSDVNSSLKLVILICLLFVCFFGFLLSHILFFVKEAVI